MKRVLIISYYWPPAGGSGVQRWVKFAKYLPAEGWQPVIYTPENPEMTSIDRSLELEIPSQVEVVKTRIIEPYGFYRKLTGSKGKGGQQQEVNPINGEKKTWKQKISLFIRGNFFIPDPRCMWIGPSVRYLKKYLKKHPVDVIVSSGPPHSMHLIARKLAMKTGIPWIADFRDPWTGIFYFKHLHLTRFSEKIHHRMEKNVMDGADVLVAVTDLVKEEFEKLTDTPVVCITNGFDETDIDQVVEPDGYFNLTHTGMFASNGNPEVLWKVLGEKCREDEEFRKQMRLRLVGKVDQEVKDSIIRNGLEDNLKDLGYQSHQTAIREQLGASILLLPCRVGSELRAIIPGKLFEYLSVHHPILGFGQPDGSMARIVNESNAGAVYDWDDYESTRAYIEDSWNRFKEGRLVSEAENISQYSRKELTARMARLMESLINKEK